MQLNPQTRLPDRFSQAHPLLLQKYAVFTPPIDELVSNIANWIDQQVTGAYIYGPSRYGKTTAVRHYLPLMLNEKFGHEIPLVIWSRPLFDKVPSESRFWREILRVLNYELSGARGATDVYKDQVVSSLLAEAVRTNVNYVVIIVDEAQGISDAELKWFLALQNDLAIDSVRMSLFLIGAHQMGYIFSSLAMTENRHLAARFLTANAPFHGIRDVREIEFALQGYDEDSEWPIGSGTTYTAYFAPEAYASGFRLADSAPVVWEAMVALLPEAIGFVREFPMKHIALSTERALKEIACGVDVTRSVSRNAWLERLNALDFPRHMSIVVDTLPRKKSMK